ncbi:DUF3971 domain-containing protein [Falsiroseomonas bella]|uniref:DUF3971 domain-containing protein n=1 Tax=Falsiroseomonas bella TaxID=2184016 RepID=A0A317FJI4_9PROT|nr:DUF3971 domain-containing protein [Falsiroseomonas bella]
MAREAHRLAHLLLGLCLLLLLGLAVLGWRLAQGPIPLDFLARAIEQSLNTPDSEAELDIGHVGIAWEGLHGEGSTPLEIQLSGVRMVGRDGAVRAELPDASVSLSLPWLLRGSLAPSRLELRGAVLRLRRDEEGRLSLQLGPPGAEPEAATEDGGAALRDRIAAMMRPPGDEQPLDALRNLAITGARVVVEDAQLGAVWAMDDVALQLRRRAEGGVAGRVSATMQLGEARIPVNGTAVATGQPAQVEFRFGLPALGTRQLAATLPGLEPLGMMDAPVHGEVHGRISTDGAVWELGVTAESGAGRLDLAQLGSVPIAAGDLSVQVQPRGAVLRQVRLHLAGPEAPTLTATGTATRHDAGWRMQARLGLDALPAAGLRAWWPEGVARGARDWVVENVTAGTARNGAWEITAEATADLSDLRVTEARGAVEVSDATVHWLRPIPPAEGVQGRILFGLDAVTVEAAAARQSGTGLELRGGTVRILLTPADQERAEIELSLAGPAADGLALLKHPRLKLFERRPLPVQSARGTLEGRLSLAFPLLNDLPVEQIRIGAQGRLRDLRVPDVALGQALERGQFEVTVDTDGLRASGTGNLGPVAAARLGLQADFRRGPASQVVLRATMQGRATGAQLAALDLGHEEVLSGPVGLDLRYQQMRSGAARIDVRGDLREARLMLDPFGWSKPPGQNAGADLVLRLNRDALEAIESFRVEAPSLLLRGSAQFGAGARLQRVAIAEGRLEGSRFAGEARPPARADAAWQISLRGPALDLRQPLSRERVPEAPHQASGPAFDVQARFERVLLGERRELAAVEGQVQVDGHGVLRAGRVTGRTGPRGPFEMTLQPQGQGRSLRLTAQDAGALLGAFDVLRHIEGGRLSVTATYASNAPGAALSGSAEMDEFVVHNAPAFGKLLQAMTLFGLVEALSGPGLNFVRLVAPFTLTPDALQLEDARAFSASLGLTARGTLDRRRERVAMDGTIVPAYILNSLLGHIPLLGRIFSPERGGGLFAATFRLRGPLADPEVSVNPLAALTPGFLRGLFDIGQQGAPQPAGR